LYRQAEQGRLSSVEGQHDRWEKTAGLIRVIRISKGREDDDSKDEDEN